MIEAILKRNAVSSTEKLIYIVISTHQDEQGKTILSYTQISRMASVSKTTVITVVESLVRKGLLEKETHKGDYGTSVNKYKALDPGERI